MSEIGDLLVGISTLIGALTSAWVIVRQSRQNSSKQARRAAKAAAKKLLTALADNEITPDEVNEIRDALQDREDDE